MASRDAVLVIDHAIHPAGLDEMRAVFDVRQVPYDTDEDAIIEAGEGCRGVFMRRGKFTRKMMDAMPDLRIIVRHGVGYDSVDVAAATEKGIAVGITPVNDVSVNEHVFGMILGLTRRILDSQTSMRAGEWDPGSLLGMELEGKTLGIVGLGRIGSRVAKVGAAFGMTVIACDPYAQDGRFESLGVARRSFEDLLPEADIVTMHCWLTDETRHMINADTLGRMKDTAILINAARGPIVDQAALVAALTDGTIAGAGIDTFEDEPAAEDNPLRGMDNVVLSPHVAGQAHEVLRRSSLHGAASITAELTGGKPPDIVNPEAYEHR